MPASGYDGISADFADKYDIFLPMGRARMAFFFGASTRARG